MDQEKHIKFELYQISLDGKSEDIKLCKTYHNKLSLIKELSKRAYYSQLVIDSKHNMRTLWKTIKSSLNSKKLLNLKLTELLDANHITKTWFVE